MKFIQTLKMSKHVLTEYGFSDSPERGFGGSVAREAQTATFSTSCFA
nr:hypothetical protein [Bacillus licheniformis]